MKRSVLKNASFVTLLSVLKRALGFLYRILLARLLTAEGIGLYQNATSLFYVFVTLGAGGIPVTVSRFICKNRAAGERFKDGKTLSAAFLVGAFTTLPFLILFLAFGQKLTFLFSDTRAILPTKLLFIGLTFSSLYHSLRGAFWGNKQLILPNVLELIEECINVAVGVLLLSFSSSLEDGVIRATAAVAITDTSCFLIAFITYFAQRKKLSSPKGHILPLIRSAAPITAMRVSTSLINSIVATLLPFMLVKSGLTQSDALSKFGVVTGMVMPILFTPSTLIGSLTFVLTPELSENYYKKNFKTLALNIERGLFSSIVIACVLIPFFFAIGEPIGLITFQNGLAGEMIALSSPILLPISLMMILSGVLNSMGYEKQTFFFSLVGETALLICILALPKLVGIYAYVIAIGVNFTLSTLLSLRFLFKRLKPSGSFFKRTLICLLLTIPLCLFGRLSYRLFLSFTGELLCVILTAVCLALLTLFVYFVAGFLPKKATFKVFLRKK